MPLVFPVAEAPASGRLVEIAPQVFWLRMPLPFALDHINLWLLDDGDAWTIVDCGISDARTRELWQLIFAEYLGGRPVQRVLSTHYHPDHAGLATWLTERFGVPLLMSQGEFLTAHALIVEGAGYDPARLGELYRSNGLDAERTEQLRLRSGQYRKGVPDFPLTYSRLFDGANLRLAGEDWRVIMGYGHAPEHAALYCAKLGVLISGDMVLPKISTNIGVWSHDPDGDPLGQFLASLDRHALLPDDTLVLPSHGLPFRGLRERVGQLHEHHRDRLDAMHAACSQVQTAADLMPVLFKRQLDIHQLFFAMGESIAHLHTLMRQDRVVREVGADGVRRYRAVA
jgi:glyoxylase-like metal-dependent hydrolase (beta-lactamase superfamily II)